MISRIRGFAKQQADARLVLALDDEVLVEERIANLDVLHPEELRDAAEHAFPVDLEPEAAGIHERRAHPRVHDRDLARGHGERVQRQRPATMLDDDLVALPEAAVHELSVHAVAELLPDLLLAWPEDSMSEAHERGILAEGNGAHPSPPAAERGRAAGERVEGEARA